MEKNKNDGLIALAKAVSLIGPINKNRTAKVPTKGGGFYTYDYADLSSILEAIKGPLSAEGIFLSQSINMANTSLVTKFIYIHSGEVVSESQYPILFDSDPQKIGSAITYARRYSICVMLNIFPDDDDDGNTGNGNPPEKTVHKTPPAGPTPLRSLPTPKPTPAAPVQPRVAPVNSKTIDYQKQPGSPGDFKIPYGRDKGKAIRSMSTSQIHGDIAYWSQAKRSEKGIPPLADDYLINLMAYMEWLRNQPVQPEPDWESFDNGDRSL